MADIKENAIGYEKGTTNEMFWIDSCLGLAHNLGIEKNKKRFWKGMFFGTVGFSLARFLTRKLSEYVKNNEKEDNNHDED